MNQRIRCVLFQSAQNRLLIKNGKVVNDDGIIDSDVYIEDGIIRYVAVRSCAVDRFYRYFFSCLHNSVISFM